MRFPPLSEESHIVREGLRPRVRLSPFGWFVVLGAALSVALISSALTLLSIVRFR